MTDNTTQPVKDTTPATNHRSKNSFSNNHSGNNLQDITIWDGVVRLCHCGLVICFITNYFIVEPGRLYHEIAGYSAVFFVVVRIIWGFTRPPAESAYQDRHASRDINYDCHNKSTYYDCHDKDNISYDCHNKDTNDCHDKDIWGFTRPPAESVYQDRHASRDINYDCHNKSNDKNAYYDCHDKDNDCHDKDKGSSDTFYDCLNREALNEPNYASFRTINLSSQAFKEHLQHLKHRNVPVLTGHNPFGWLMIFAVIGLIVGLGVTGFLMEEIDALFGNSTLEWIHGTFADVLYACVLVHIAAVFFVQYRGRIQLLRPMITGLRRDLTGDDKP